MLQLGRIVTYSCIALIIGVGIFLAVRAAHRVSDSVIALPSVVDGIREGDVVTTDGVRLHYWLYDRGTDVVTIKLHGGPGGNSAASRAYFGETFADTFGSVLYFDQRGCGASQREVDSSTFTFDRAVKDVQELRAAVIPDHKVVLDGGSFGVMLAVAYGAMTDDDVEAYILASPAMDMAPRSPGYDTFTSAQFAANARDTAAAEAAIVGFVDSNDPAWDSSSQQEIQQYWVANEQLHTASLLSLLAELADEKVLVISGDSDPIVTPTEVDAMKPYLPSATFVQIPNAGHNFAIAHDDEYLAAVQTFLDGVK